MKAYDLYVSLFVEFCIGIFITAVLGILLRPAVSDEISLPILGSIFAVVWSTLACFLSGAGYREKNNRLAMLFAGIVGWMFLGAGFVGFGFQEISPHLSLVVAIVLFYVGHKVDWPGVNRLLIIRGSDEPIAMAAEVALDQSKDTCEN